MNITSKPKDVPEPWRKYLETVRDKPTTNELRSVDLRGGCYNSRDLVGRMPRPVIRIG